MALITIQSLARMLGTPKERMLRRFLERPTYVVVDECHHAGAPSYRALLDEILRNEPRMLLGLTATPHPTSLANRFHLKERFPRVIHREHPVDLMEKRILARPLLHTIDTGETVRLTPEELQFAAKMDIPDSVFDRLDRERRNHQIVAAWLSDRERWGKTLVFATRIDHAESLARDLAASGAPARALHSASGHRSETLAWFREQTAPSLLVSVGMLIEGVDLPEARSAFLARPTTSRVLLQQMVGRVLRGPRAGGEAEAHIVNFRDRWSNFAEILDPAEVLDAVPRPSGKKQDAEHEGVLPAILTDDDDADIPPGVWMQLARQLLQTSLVFDGSNVQPYTDAAVLTTALAGYYELEERTVPVLEHQRDGFASLLEAIANGERFSGRGLMSFFDDAFPPHPTHRGLDALVAYVREFDVPPPFHELRARLSPACAADAILAAGPLTEDRRAAIIHEHWAKSVARIAFPTLQRFEETVDAELRARRQQRARLHGERPIPQSCASRLPAIRRADRALEPILKVVAERAFDLVPEEVSARLGEYLPPIGWTRRIGKSSFGHWSIRLSGRAAGSQMIRINRLLRAPRSQVPDGALEYLVYHELLHAMLPGQGHDAEFRELEALWPGADDWDAWFDTLHERFDTRPERYSRTR